MHLLKLYFDYVQFPRETLRQLVEERSFSQACAGYLMAALGWVLFFKVSSGSSLPVFMLLVCLLFAAELIAGSIWAAFCSFVLNIGRVAVPPAPLFVLIGAVGFIRGLLIAFALIGAMFPVFRFLGVFVLLGVFCLQLGFLIRGLKRVYNISYGWAALAWVLSFLAPGVVLIVGGILFIWMLVLLF